MRSLRHVLLAALVPFAFAPAAHAALHTVDVTITWDSGPDAGTQSFASFAYDDALAPAGGGVIDALGLLHDFDFGYRGVQYGADALQMATLRFDGAATLRAFFFGNNCDTANLSCAVTSDATDRVQWYLFHGQVIHHAAAAPAASAPGLWDLSSGTTVASPWAAPVAAVPEPQTYALMLGGLAALAAAARRRRSR